MLTYLAQLGMENKTVYVFFAPPNLESRTGGLELFQIPPSKSGHLCNEHDTNTIKCYLKVELALSGFGNFLDGEPLQHSFHKTPLNFWDRMGFIRTVSSFFIYPFLFEPRFLKKIYNSKYNLL